MFRKVFCVLLAFLSALSQSTDALALQIRWDSDSGSPIAGLGFFLAPDSQPDHGQYLMRAPLGLLRLTGDAIWLTRWEAQPPRDKGVPQRGAQPQPARRGVNLKISFPGANPRPTLVTEKPMPGLVSIFQGQDPQNWSTGLGLWGQVRYQNLYPGVDLVFRSTAAGFSWAFNIQPGADASRLKMHVEGANALHATESGPVAQTAVGDLYLPPLELQGATLDQIQAVQELASAGAGGMEIYPSTNAAGNAAAQLLLDNPSRLNYSTLLGGSSWETAYDVAVDSTGAAYLVGETASADFPTTPGTFDSSLAQTDVFAVKVTPHGALSYATFIGGGNQETGWSVAVENGVAYIGGETWSTNFPVTPGSSAYSAENEAFVVALNAAGTGLVYSRLLVGRDQDVGYAIAVESGSAYLTGSTYSNDFMGAGYSNTGDVFVIKLTSTGAVSYVRTTGGNDIDSGMAIAVVSGAAWVTGETWSINFTGSNAGEDDVFILSLSTTGTVATRKTYGGAGMESGKGIMVNSTGAIFVTGMTASSDFPFTEGALHGSSDDVFLLEVNSTNTAVLYATALGGSGNETGRALALDSMGGIIVTGVTYSGDFPVTSNAYQSTLGGNGDGFVTRYLLTSTSPGHRTYSSYLGGSGDEDIKSVVVTSTSLAYLTGLTTSPNFPTTSDGLYRSLTGAQDTFLALMAVGPVPAIAIQKTTNNEDANTTPGPLVRVGSAVTWRYTVANTGEQALTNVRVTDDKGVIVTCPKTSLAIGENMLCTASGLAVKGQYTNLGSVSANTPSSTTITSTDLSHYFGADPKTVLIKKVNGVDANTVPGPYVQPGGDVVWTYEISNTGNVDLTSVTVVDNNGTPTVTTDDVTVCTIPLLPPGTTDTTTCRMQGQAVAGQYTNIAVVTGTAPGSLGTVNNSDHSSYFGSAPALSLEARTNNTHYTTAPGPYLLEGAAITWQYVVRNSGNVVLTNVTVRDDNGTPEITTDDRIACTIASLAVNANQTCTLIGMAVAGQYHNIATASGTPPVGPVTSTTDDSFYYGSNPRLALEYAVNGSPADTLPGLYVLTISPLNLTYQVTNTGNVPMSSLRIVDNNGTPTVTTDDITICTIASLAVAASETCTRGLAALSGQRYASATVTATPPSPLANVTATNAMYYFGATTSLALVKRTNGQDGATAPGVYVAANATINWTYLVTNTGTVPLTNIHVVDDNGTPANTADDQVPVGCTSATLAAGASITCTLSGMAQAGPYTNTAVVTAAPPSPLPAINASDSNSYFGVSVAVTLAKRTNGQDAETTPGPLVALDSTITWTYLVTNSSNVAVDISIVDDNGTPANTADDASFCAGSLAVGANTTCTRTGSALAGQYTNIARVMATPPGGLPPLTVQDTSHYFGVDARVSLVKSTNGLDANTAPGPYIHIGDPVTWTYLVTNTGNVALSGITVSDDRDVRITCPGTALAVGASMTCTAVGVAVAGQYENTGTVTASPPAPFSQVSAADLSHYFGSTAGIELEKFTNGVSAAATPGPYIRVGQPVTWTYVLRNSGNIPLTEIRVMDNRGVTVTCPATTLAVGASITCSASGVAAVGQYSNTGTVQASLSGETGYVYDSDTSYYFGANPSIDLVKKTNGEDANTPPGPYVPAGQTVGFAYEVTNTGNIALENITVSDDTGQIASCSRALLPVGQTQICTSSATALTGAQVTAGSTHASAVSGMGEVADSDISRYFGYYLHMALVKTINGEHVTAGPGPTVLAGSTVRWDYTVTNQSNVVLFQLTVTDNQGVSVTCPKTGLSLGESMTCTGSGKAGLNQYSNIGTALGQFLNDTVQAQDTSYYFGVRPLLMYIPAVFR